MVLFEIGTLAASSWRWIGSVDQCGVRGCLDQAASVGGLKLGVAQTLKSLRHRGSCGISSWSCAVSASRNTFTGCENEPAPDTPQVSFRIAQQT